MVRKKGAGGGGFSGSKATAGFDLSSDFAVSSGKKKKKSNASSSGGGSGGGGSSGGNAAKNKNKRSSRSRSRSRKRKNKNKPGNNSSNASSSSSKRSSGKKKDASRGDRGGDFGFWDDAGSGSTQHGKGKHKSRGGGSGGSSAAPSGGGGGGDSNWKPVGKKKLKRLFNGTVRAREARVVNGVEIKEWQRVPRQLLHEYCQRTKRPKPRYIGAKSMGGAGTVTARVILPDPKGKQERDVSLCPEQGYESRKEAEQYAAILALHHLDPKIPHERKLPEPYRSVWLSMSSANPEVTPKSAFSSQAERAAKEVERKQRANQRERREQERLRQYVSVVMSESNRRFIEDIIKAEASGKPAPSSGGPAVTGEMNRDPRLAKLEKKLTKMGFHRTDASTGAAVAWKAWKSSGGNESAALKLDDALDYLVLHVPEHRLPEAYNPRGLNFEVLVSGNLGGSDGAAGGKGADEDGDSAEAQARRVRRAVMALTRDGFPQHISEKMVADALAKNKGALLLEHIREQLFYEMCTAVVPELVDGGDGGGGDEEEEGDDAEAVLEEMDALAAIFDKQFECSYKGGRKKGRDDEVPVSWSVRFVPEDSDSSITLTVTLPRAAIRRKFFSAQASYPHVLPVFSVRATGLSGRESLIVSQQLAVAVRNQGLLGLPFTYSLVLWLQENWESARAKDFVSPDTWILELDALNDDDAGDDAGHTPSSVRDNLRGGQHKPLRRDKKLDEQLFRELQKKQKSDNKYKKMQKVRNSLPAAGFRKEILGLLDKHGVVVVSGETGCGKSTQIPQFILDACIAEQRAGSVCNIICTQPRRISAIGLAERVASERAERVGDSVGYRIRMQAKTSRRTRLTFVTTGILLRMLSFNHALDGVSHVVVDEVHERSTDIDFLLIILRQLRRRRPDLRIVLMSATLDAELFASYFDGCPVVAMQGRTFPVEEHFVSELVHELDYSSPSKYRRGLKEDAENATIAELTALLPRKERRKYSERTLRTVVSMHPDRIDTELAMETVFYILRTYDEGGILVFMPGLADITSLIEAIRRGMRAHGVDSNAVWLIPLHSSLSTLNQQRLFQSPPAGVRKVVVSTNIAETSVTVNDVVFVVDSGKMKEMQYDPAKQMAMLVETWEAKANATQRLGRAGRVRAGHCFRLYSRAQAQQLRDSQDPEIKRTPLEHICLQIKLLFGGAMGMVAGVGAKDDDEGEGDGEDGKKHKHKKKKKKSKKKSKSKKQQQAVSIKQVLHLALEPPDDETIDSAIQTLYQLQALDSAECLTPMGLHLARLPVGNVRIGKMLIFAALFGCVSPVVAIAALMSHRSPFLSPLDARQEADAKRRELFSVRYSDHLSMLRAFEKWSEIKRNDGRQAAYEFCSESFLSFKTLDTVETLTTQFVSALADIGFVSGRGRRLRLDTLDPQYDALSSNRELVLAVLVAGLYPNVVRVKQPAKQFQMMAHGATQVDNEARDHKYYTRPAWATSSTDDASGREQQDGVGSKDDTINTQHGYSGRVFVHPKSVNFSENSYPSPWLVYLQMMATSKVWVYDSSMASPYALLLFGGPLDVDHNRGLVKIDNWITFQAHSRIASLVRALRRLLNELLTKKIGNPDLDIRESPITRAAVTLLTSAGF